MTELFESAILSAVVAVGIVQMVKKWLPENIKSKWYTLIYAVVCFGFSLAIGYMPESIVNGFLGLSVGTMGYDNIYKVVQKLIERLGNNEATGE